MITISDLIARWNTKEGKPYKGMLIDFLAYEAAPDSIGCMCAQGQVLHLLGGWSPVDLYDVSQDMADVEVAKLLNISHNHAVLLRVVNDTVDGAPSIVLTNPEKVLGDKWSKVLDFWYHIDRFGRDEWSAIGHRLSFLPLSAKIDAKLAAEKALGVFWEFQVAQELTHGPAPIDAAYAMSEVQGFDVLREQGKPLHFLPVFGFADLDAIPPRPANYGPRLSQTASE